MSKKSRSLVLAYYEAAVYSLRLAVGRRQSLLSQMRWCASAHTKYFFHLAMFFGQYPSVKLGAISKTFLNLLFLFRNVFVFIRC